MNRNLETLSAVEAVEQSSLASHQLPTSTYHVLKGSAETFSKQTAIEFFLSTGQMYDPTSISYHQLFENINRCANMFRDHGIDQENLVAFILPNLPETHYVIWGGEAAGTVLSLNPLLETEQLATLLQVAKVRWLVTLGPTPGSDIWEKSLAAAQQVDTLEGIFQVTVAPYLKGFKKAFIATKGYMSRHSRGNPKALKIKNFHSELERFNPRELEFPAPKSNDIASCFCTGGTTGLPKLALRPHSAEVYNAWALGRATTENLKPGVAVFCGLPLFHVNGQIVTGLAPWAKGGKVVMGTPAGYRGEGVVERFWEIIEHFKIAAFSGVPTLYAALLNYPVGERDTSSLQAALCGAAPMPKELFRQFQQRTGIRIIEGYGLTEGTCASSLNPGLSEVTVGSIGIRLPYQKMCSVILDDEGKFLRDARMGEVGVIAIHGPNVFSGYLEPLHNIGIWIEREGLRWLNTGDMGREDEEGYFWLTGRKKELIIRGGHNIDPKTIEEVMHSHPAIALAAAVGRPDAYAGELPVVYVELEKGQTSSPDELLEFAETHIAEKAAIPKEVILLEQLPVTPVGKIFKPDLVKLEIQRIVQDEAQTLNLRLDSIEVKQDSKRGLVAYISIDQPERLNAVLGKYAFEFDFV